MLGKTETPPFADYSEVDCKNKRNKKISAHFILLFLTTTKKAKTISAAATTLHGVRIFERLRIQRLV